MGSEMCIRDSSMEDAQKIFGKDLVRVKTLDKMAESVGKALCHQISTF